MTEAADFIGRAVLDRHPIEAMIRTGHLPTASNSMRARTLCLALRTLIDALGQTGSKRAVGCFRRARDRGAPLEAVIVITLFANDDGIPLASSASASAPVPARDSIEQDFCAHFLSMNGRDGDSPSGISVVPAVPHDADHDGFHRDIRREGDEQFVSCRNTSAPHDAVGCQLELCQTPGLFVEDVETKGGGWARTGAQQCGGA